MDKDDNKVQPIPADTGADAPRPGHAAALIQPWFRLGRRLVPLIGENGFGALFGRSVRLVAPRHAWLQVDPAHKASASLLAGLEQLLAAADASAARAANDELMSTFTRQLGALIGPGLTTRLLAETANVDEKNQEEQAE